MSIPCVIFWFCSVLVAASCSTGRPRERGSLARDVVVHTLESNSATLVHLPMAGFLLFFFRSFPQPHFFYFAFYSRLSFMQSICLLYNNNFHLKINIKWDNVCSAICIASIPCCFIVVLSAHAFFVGCRSLFIHRLLDVWTGLCSSDLCKVQCTVSVHYKSRETQEDF